MTIETNTCKSRNDRWFETNNQNEKKIKKEEEENRFVDKHRLTSTIVRSGELCCREAASSLACGIQPALRRRPMNSSRTSAS